MTFSTRFLVLGLAFATLGALAQDAPRSLNAARDAVRQGTSPGIVLIPARQRTPQPAAASAPPLSRAAGPSTTDNTTPAGSVAADKDQRGTLRRVIDDIRAENPPTGKPMSSASRLDSPSIGIPIRSGASASQPR